MARRHALIALTVLPLLALPAAAAAPSDLAIGGRVLDDRGKPLAGAEVALVRVSGSLERARLELAGTVDPAPAATARTGTDGGFRVAAPEPGMWKVRVAAKGFVPRERTLAPLLAAAELEEAKLERDAGLAVKVLDAGGRPVAGARVSAEPVTLPMLRGPESWRTAERLATTGADGRVALPRGDRERLRLRAVAPGHLAAELEPTGASAELRLAAGCARTVAVREPGGAPAAGALVAAGRFPLGMADDAGRLTIAAPCDRETTLVATAADRRSAKAALRPARPAVGKGEPPPLVVTLPRQPARLAGRVLEKGSRAAVPEAFVWPAGQPGDAVRTDREGRYAAVVATGASLHLSAASARHLPGSESAPPAPAEGDAAGPTFALEPAASLAGTVVDEAGRPVAGAEVRASSTSRPGVGLGGIVIRTAGGGGPWTRSDESGRFRLRLPAGQPHDLAASHADFAAAKLPVPALAPHQARTDVKIVLPRGLAAFGRVVDAAEQPIAGATVRLTAAAESEPGTRALFARLMGDEEKKGPEAATDAGGRFSFEHLSPGRYDLEAKSPGFAPVVVRGLEVRVGAAPLDLGTVILEPGATVEGRVVDRRGQPIPGASVFVRQASGGAAGAMVVLRSGRLPGEQAEPQATTDAEGRFMLGDLRPGERIGIAVSKRGYAEGVLPGVEAPTAAPVEIALAAASRVSGRVVDADDDPVAHAQVSLTKEGSRMVIGGRALPGMPAGEAATDDDGRFTVEDLEPGVMTLAASARGFLPAELAGIDVREGEEASGLEVVLQRGATVLGRVLAADGTPVGDARVSVVEGGSAPLFSRTLITTDGDGAYRLEGVAPGQRSIAAEHVDHVRAVRDLEVRPGENRLDLRLGRGVDVSGLVLDVGGRPVAGATVELVTAGRISFGGGHEATSDAAGVFRLAGVAPGTYRLQGHKAGFAPASLPEEVQVGTVPVDGLELRLDGGGAIRGRLVGLAADEVAQVNLVAMAAGPGENLMANGRVDYQGEYRVEPVAAGEWTVVARVRDSGRQAQGRVTVPTGGGEALLDLEFGGGLALFGRVVRGGEPVAGALVLVRGQDVARNGSATTTSEGVFRVEGLEAGTYEVSVAQLETGLQYDERVELATDREVTIELPTNRVSGVVVDATDGSPIAGALVSLKPLERPAGGRFLDRAATSDEAGAFTLTDVGDGELRITAKKEGYEPGETTVRMGRDADVSDVRLTLAPSAGLVVEVRGPSGAPPAEIQAALLDAAGRPALSGRYPTGENGRVRFTSAPAGRFRLLLADGNAAARLDVTVPGPPLTVSLTPTAELAVSVPALAEDRVVATLTIIGEDGQPLRALNWAGDVQTEWRSGDGRFSVRGVPAGAWRLVATAADGRTFQGRAATGSGGRVEVGLE